MRTRRYYHHTRKHTFTNTKHINPQSLTKHMQNENVIRILIESLREKTQHHPDDSVSWYNLGVAHDMIGEAEASIAYYRIAIKHDPKYVLPRFNLGCTLLKMGAAQVALDEFLALTKVAPNVADGFFMLGATYGALDQTEKLIEATEAGLKLEPDSVRAQHNLDIAYDRLREFEDGSD